ncbi:hypothetical protein ABT187_42160 [Streptomyces sp. NPDC001817]
MADTVLRIVTGHGTGERWFIGAGRAPEPLRFRTVPGPGKRTEATE